MSTSTGTSRHTCWLRFINVPRLTWLHVLQVTDKTAAAGWPGIKLSELGEAEDAASATTPAARPSPAASAVADEEMLVSSCWWSFCDPGPASKPCLLRLL